MTMNASTAAAARVASTASTFVADGAARARARVGGPALPPILLRKAEAAAVMGMSIDFYEEHVQPEVRVVRRGRLVLVPVAELQRWAEANAEATL